MEIILHDDWTPFPSPCGEKVGINAVPEGNGIWLLEVSVPLRGKGRDQHEEPKLVVRQINGRFPSPCGEKVGIN